MRRTAYLKALEEAQRLPECVPELSSYFNDNYNPRREAISHIVKAARLDVGALFDGEFVDIYNRSRGIRE